MYLYCTRRAGGRAGGNHNGFLGFLSAVAFKWYTLTTNNNIVCSYIVYVVVPTRYLHFLMIQFTLQLYTH